MARYLHPNNQCFEKKIEIFEQKRNFRQKFRAYVLRPKSKLLSKIDCVCEKIHCVRLSLLFLRLGTFRVLFIIKSRSLTL